MLLAAGAASYSTRDTAACHPVFLDTYPAVRGHRVRGKHDLDRWRAGDVLILPEQASCPTDLLQRGVRAYIWLLGAVGPGLAQFECAFDLDNQTVYLPDPAYYRGALAAAVEARAGDDRHLDARLFGRR